MDDRSSTPAVIATDDRGETRAGVRQLESPRAHRSRRHRRALLLARRSVPGRSRAPHAADRAPARRRSRRSIGRLAAADRADLAELARALAEPPPTDRDLPPTLAEYFVERDGSVGKLAYVDPNDEHIEANLYRLTDAIRAIPLPSGKVVESSGELVVFADVLRAMRRDASTLTLAAACSCLLVLAVVTRRVGAIVRVGGALIAGVAVMVGHRGAPGQKLNFFNFVALPTTFGIGIDYAINIEERIRQRGRATSRARSPRRDRRWCSRR